MNYTIQSTSTLATLLPSLDAIAVARGRPTGTRYELEDTVIRCYDEHRMLWAEDIGTEAAPLHAQAAALIAAKAAADEAARAAAEAEALANPQPWRVSKDTIISRVLEDGKLPQVMAALASQSAEQQFLWNNSLWFWSTNATLRGLCTALEMDPDEILARDPFLF